MADNNEMTKEMKEMNLAQLEVELAQHSLNRKSHNFRKKQILAELAKIDSNDMATEKAHDELEKRIKQLQKEIVWIKL